MRSLAICLALLISIGLWASPTPASAKNRAKSCAKAEKLFQETGQGDRDGDGLSDCREKRQLHTSPKNPDTDGDGVSDGDEYRQYSDPRDPDSDHDGVRDCDDPTPGIPKQRVEAFLDGLTCPQTGVLGSITALGISPTVNDMTVFEDTTCADLATELASGSPVFVEIVVLEDSTGALTASRVQIEDARHGDDDDQGEDEDRND